MQLFEAVKYAYHSFIEPTVFLAQDTFSEMKCVGPSLTAVHLRNITGHTTCCGVGVRVGVLIIATSVSRVGRGVLRNKYRVVRGILIALFKEQISPCTGQRNVNARRDSR